MSTQILLKLKDIDNKLELQKLAFNSVDEKTILIVFSSTELDLNLKLNLPPDASKILLFNLYAYSLLSVNDLKLKLRNFNLKVSGLKSELLLRLVPHLSNEIEFSDEILSKILYEMCSSSGIYQNLSQVLESDANLGIFISPLKKSKRVKDFKEVNDEFKDGIKEESKEETKDDSSSDSSLNPSLEFLKEDGDYMSQIVPDSLDLNDDDTLNSSESELKSDSEHKIASLILNKVKADKLQIIAQSICNKKISKKEDCIAAIINSYEENKEIFSSIKYYVLFTCERDTISHLASDFKVTTTSSNDSLPKIIKLIVENATVEYSKKKKLVISPSIRKEMWEFYFPKCTEGVCFVCNQIIVCHGSRSNTYQAGHIISEANGGIITLDNLRPVCKTCNTKMGTKHMLDYAREIGVFNSRIFTDFI